MGKRLYVCIGPFEFTVRTDPVTEKELDDENTRIIRQLLEMER